ncbi:MAG: hypothetical protein K0V04_30915 [Deltaproteobacteria bacterium]|nr:hypothetical protein [Deltaproteobacteria bacterium]
MSTSSNDEGFVDRLLSGAVFGLGAAAAGLVLHRLFGREPELVVVLSTDDDDSGSDDGSEAEA